MTRSLNHLLCRAENGLRNSALGAVLAVVCITTTMRHSDVRVSLSAAQLVRGPRSRFLAVIIVAVAAAVFRVRARPPRVGRRDR